MEAVIAIVLSCFAVVYSSKCDLAAPLPKPLSLNVMEKATGVWYETVTSNDYISAQFICGTASEQQVNPETNSGSGLVTKYYNNAKPRTFYMNYHVTEDGYIEQVNVDDREKAAHDFDEAGTLNSKALEEDDGISIHPQEFSFIGDAVNYLAYVKCTKLGWVVWINTPQKVLTTEELLFIHNELVKHGIHTQLRLAQCANINPK